MQQVAERRFLRATGNALLVKHTEAPRTFELDFIPAGLLKRLIVKQVAAGAGGGVAAGFSVNLYNAHISATEVPGSSTSIAPDDIDPDLAKIIPEQGPIGAGVALELFSEDGYAFRNQMGSHSVPVRKVYLEINPADAGGDTLWEVVLAAIPAIVS